MRRDKLFGNMFMRLSACALMAFACAGEVWGIGNTISKPRLNPAFVKWQHEQKNQRQQANKSSVTNVQKRTTRLLASTPEADTDLLPLTEGLVPTMIDFSYLNSLNSMNFGSVSGALLPSHDPRPLTPVRHQDPKDADIKTCWAQASVGSIETWLLSNGHGKNQFSVRNVVNLSGWDTDNNFHTGGNHIRSSAYFLRWGGPVWEADDPYTNRYGIVDESVSAVLEPVYHVQQTRLVPARTGALDNDSLKRAILEFGGLYATMKLYSPYYSGTSKLVDYWSNKGAYYCTEKGAGHAVTLVGWDDTYSKTNFNSKCRPVGNGAWIVKDSYGVDLPRDNGYIYVSYYDTTFAYTESCAFPLIESKDNYGSVYQYDELGQVDEWGIPAGEGYIFTSGYGANMFTANKAEELAAIGFYATVPKAAYKIRIYTGCNASKPSSGTLSLEQSGTVDDYAGFYTLPLKNTVAVAKGQRFSVVVMLSTPGAAPFSLEIAVDGYTSNASANAGESFFSTNGVDWHDFTSNANLTHGIPANFCLKAYTKAVTHIKPTLLSIVVKPEDEKTMSLKSGDKVQMKCDATYSNNAKSNVTDVAQWSLTSGRSYATLSSGGLLTAKNVPVLEPQTITVQAVYAEDGIIATNRYGFSMAETPPEAPTDVTATQGTDTSCIHVNWTAPAGATEYAVYRAAVNNIKNVYHLENVNVAKYHDTGSVKPIVPGVDYWYFIKAKNANPKASEYSTPGAMGWRKLSPPESESVIASDNLHDKVSLEWGEVEGATHYRVYRADEFDGEKTAISGWQTARTYNDVPKEKDRPYYYYVAAAVDASGNRPSDYSIVEDGMMVSPVTVDYLELKGEASIASGGYADYTADAIYTDEHRVENVSPVTWTVSGEGASVFGNRVTAATVTENKKVTLKASYTEDGKIARGEKQITISAVKPVAPRNVAANATGTGVTVTWSAVAGAATYKVYRDDEPVGSVSVATFTDTSATPGITYSYTVSAANSAGESARSASVSAMIPLAAPTGVKASTDDATAVRISWLGVNGAAYYRVARSTSAEGEKIELGTCQVGTAYSDTTATPGTEYYYFVRASIDSSASVVSAWSDGVIGKIPSESPTLQTLVIGGPERISASGTAAYSCAAVYSDGNKENVNPDWSLSSTSAATIDSSGVISAKAVTSDAKVTVTAEFGGLQASREVVIVAPLSEASATVSDVSVAPRWPFGTKVDIDYTLDTTPAGMRALVTLFGYDNDHRKEMPATTITGDSANQAVLAGRHRLTWDVGAVYPSSHAASFDVKLEAVPYVIAVPANVAASQGTSTRGVNLSWDAVEDATGYEIWRASGSMNTADAVLVTNVEAAVAYEDTSVNPGDIYFYWFKTVTQYGTGDFSASVFGYRARVVGTVVFDANGGTASAYSLGYTAGSPYGTLPSASRTGYEFAGWFTSATGGSEVTAATPADENIATLYARWMPHTYTIHFDANGGTGTMADLPMTYDMATNLTANAFSNNGWAFTGWATSANGAVVHGDGAEAVNLSADDNATVTLYAVWGLGAPQNITATQGMALSATTAKEITLAWEAANGAEVYRILRNTVNNLASATVLSTMQGVSYLDVVDNYTTVYYYWVEAVRNNLSVTSEVAMVERPVDLRPLKSLLNLLDFSAVGNRDGYLDDSEISRAMRNSGLADLDGDNKSISDDEMSVFQRIHTLNTDKELIHNVMSGDYSTVTTGEMEELRDISCAIYELCELSGKCPQDVTATQANYSTPKITVTWTMERDDALYYEVWQSTSSNYTQNVTMIAQVTNTLSYVDTNVTYRSAFSYKIRARFSGGYGPYSAYAYGYWGDWCFADIGKDVDLRPLKSLLNLLDFSADGNRNGYLDDNELISGMNDSSTADLDGDRKNVSTAEMSVFTRIQALNTDKELLSHIMKGDYSYRNMTLAQFRELQSISDAIKELTKNRSN